MSLSEIISSDWQSGTVVYTNKDISSCFKRPNILRFLEYFGILVQVFLRAAILNEEKVPGRRLRTQGNKRSALLKTIPHALIKNRHKRSICDV